MKSEYRQESRPSVISRNSIVILVDNVERNLNNAFSMVVNDFKTKIGFQELGRILCLLGIFKIINYDENLERNEII